MTQNGDIEVTDTERGDRLDRAARAAVLHLLWIAPLIVLPIAIYVRVFQGLFQGDALAAAQTAREIVAGHGVATLWAFPMEIALRGGEFPRPDLAQGPLYPLVLAAFFGAFAATDRVVAAVSLLFLIATGIALYALASRAFGRTAGVLAVVFFVVGLETLMQGVSGSRLPMAAFLVTLAAVLLYGRECTARRAAAAGAVLSLAYLTDAANLALVIPFGLFAVYLGAERRWRRLALFAVGFVAVAAPWWIRNAVVAGDPFYSLRHYWAGMFTSTHPEFTLLRGTDTSALGVWSYLAEHPREFVAKIVRNLQALHTRAPAALGIYVVAFFLAGILHPLQDGRARLLRKCLYVGLVLQMVLCAAQNPNSNFMAPLVPLVLVFAAGFFVHLLGRLESRRARGWAVAVFVALAVYPTAVTLVAPRVSPNRSRANLDYMKQALPAGTVVVSDVPSQVAWYSERPAVVLPLGKRDYDAVDSEVDVGAIYLSYRLRGWSAGEGAGGWLLVPRAGLKGFVTVFPTPERPSAEALLVREDLARELGLQPSGAAMEPTGGASEGPGAPAAEAGEGPPG